MAARLTAGTLAAIIFALMLAALLAVDGRRLVLTNDEGIILEAAQRMAEGQRLYVDFFGYMSPGGYWLQTAAFRLFGYSLPVARLVVYGDFALQAAAMWWLVARWASRRAATVALVVLVGLILPQPGLLTAQHRWDSAALAILSLAWGLNGWWAAAGAAAAMAGICTPSVGLVAAVTVAWLGWQRAGRSLLYYAAGGLVTGVAAIALLGLTGSWGGFVEQMRWLREHYSAVNVMPYGSVIGGWGTLLAGEGLELAVSSLLVLALALPAILPVVAAIGVWWRRELLYPALVLLAMVVSAFPRADVMHLAFFFALPLGMSAALLARLRWGGYAGVLGVVMAGLYLASYAAAWGAGKPVQTPVGTVRTAEPLGDLIREVRPGQGLYVHPYMPVFYFLTQARNPARFSYLAPGMMGAHEERETLADLERRPPEWVLYLPLTREEFLRVFPNATGLDDRFAAIEEWIARGYAETGVSVGGYRLRRRR